MCFRIFAFEDVSIRGKLKRDSINFTSGQNPSIINNNIGNTSSNPPFTIDVSTNNSSKINTQKNYPGNSISRDGPSQKIDKSVLTKIPSVPTKSSNTGKNNENKSKRDCLIF